MSETPEKMNEREKVVNETPEQMNERGSEVVKETPQPVVHNMGNAEDHNDRKVVQKIDNPEPTTEERAVEKKNVEKNDKKEEKRRFTYVDPKDDPNLVHEPSMTGTESQITANGRIVTGNPVLGKGSRRRGHNGNNQ